MSYVYCTYLSFGDVVSPISAAAHLVGKGRFLLVSISRVCALFAAVSAVTVDPAVIQGGWGWRPCTSMTPTGAASAAAVVVASMVGGVGDL